MYMEYPPMNSIMAWLRPLVALAILAWIVYTFRNEARIHGRSPLKWSVAGVATFYGTYFITMIAIAGSLMFVFAATGDGLSSRERQLMSTVKSLTILVGFVAGYSAVLWLRRRLRLSAHRGMTSNSNT